MSVKPKAKRQKSTNDAIDTTTAPRTTTRPVKKKEVPGFDAVPLPLKHTYKRTRLPYKDDPLDDRRKKAMLLTDIKEKILIIDSKNKAKPGQTSSSSKQKVIEPLPNVVLTSRVCWTSLPGVIQAKYVKQ